MTLMKETSKSVLLFRMQTVVCAMPISHVSEILRPLPYETFKDLPPFISGVSVIRGTPLPVLNLNYLLGHEEKNSHMQRFIIIRNEDTHLACLVDEVIGIENIEAKTITEAPPLLRNTHADLISAMGVLDQKFLLVLQTLIDLPQEFRERLSKFKKEETV